MSETMELGALPEEWEVVNLGDITTKMTNGFVGIATPHYATNERGVPYLYGNNVRPGHLEFRKLLYVTEEFHRSQRKSQLAPGDMLTVQSGHIGTCAIVPESLGTANCHALIITQFRENTVHPAFISYCCNSALGMKRMGALFVGSTIAHINVKEFKSYALPLPPLPEQRKIASILTTVDSLIEQTEALIEKYRRVKQGMMADLLSRGVDSSGKLRPTQHHAPELYKQSELGWIPKEWEVEAIGSLTQRVGSGVTPTGGSEVYRSDGITFLRSQNVTHDGLKLLDVAYIDERTHKAMLSSEVYPFDVLLNITGASIGRCCSVPNVFGTANTNQHVCCIRTHEPCEPDAKYLASVLSSHIGQNQIFRLNAGGNREGLNFGQLRSFLVPWPPKALQDN